MVNNTCYTGNSACLPSLLLEMYATIILLITQKQLREAEAELLLAVKTSPKHSRAHYELGNTLNELGEKRKARHHYEVAVQLDPSLYLANTRIREL